MNADLTGELMAALGEDGFFVLTEAYAGVRLYVPANIERSDLPETIGRDHAARLAKAYPGGYIRVPLAREFRARRYVASGMTIREIALKLGLTETGVNKLIKRARHAAPIVRPSRKDPRQLDLL
ncbi:hypothetical protein [Rhizobium sp. C1]|uniref:hypothetical protein n=1 Tax=Rhizobium sp. C1 TaxID=1349799 RepID=UPI001E34A089|nr:hypothetical protein [Rhizobium sp. C1]MCD2176464.1 hypothetical protein [Rhizobium sp. C1]